MPKPLPGQSQDDFIATCIPQVIDEGTAETQEQAIAICYSMWEEAKKDIQEKLNA
jgi:hypothetical protein